MLFKRKDKKENIEENKKDISLEKKVEAVLFYKSDEVNLNFLVKTLNSNKKEIKEAVLRLKENIKDSALTIVENNNKYLLTTKSELSGVIELLKEEENISELSAPALETLSIILYKKEIDRYQLDEIRGVNSSHIIRNLLVRGLIEKKVLGKNIKYIPTLDLLSFLGLSSLDELPAYEKVISKINEIEENVNKAE